MRRLGLDDRVALGVVVLVALVIHGPALVGFAYAFRDFPSWAVPSRALWRDAVLAGRIPAWNPWVGLGVPTVGSFVHGTFYPGHLLLLIAPAAWSVPATWFAHYLFGALGGYALARRLGCRPQAALLSALVWLAGGFAVSMAGAGEKVLTLAWLPWAALGAGTLAVTSTPTLTLAGTAVAFGMLGLAGDPFAWFDGGVLSLGVGVGLRLHTDENKPPWPAWPLRVVAALTFAFMLIAPELLPALALREATERSGPALLSGQHEWALHPLRLLELVAPGVFGDPLDPSAAAASTRALISDGRGAVPWSLSISCGAGLVSLAIFAVQRRAALALVPGALFALVLALGDRTSLPEMAAAVLPPLRWFRYPEKHIVVLAGSIGLFAALGLEQAFATRPRWRYAGPALVVPLLAAWLAAPKELATALPGPLAQTAAVGACVLGALFLRQRGQASTSTSTSPATWLPAVILIAELGGHAIGLSSWVTIDKLSTKPALAEPMATPPLHPPPRVHSWQSEGNLALLPPNFGALWSLGAVPGHDALQPYRLRPLWSALAASGPNALHTFDVDWLVGPGFPPSGLHATAQTISGWSAPIASPPRVTLVDRVRIADDDTATAFMKAPGFDRAREAVVADGAHARALDTAGTPPGRCTLDRYEPERVVIDCRAERQALAVLADADYPGWSATLDDAPAPIARANVVMRGVYVPAGTHRIVFSYQPPRLRLGLTLAGFGVLAVLVLLAFERSTRRAGVGRGADQSRARTMR